MESNSSSNVESDRNFKQNQDAGEKKSEGNDSDVVYFDCKNCRNTFSVRRDQENRDPNSKADVCKNCTAKQRFQNAMISSEDTSESIIRKTSPSVSFCHQPVPPAVQSEFDAINMSPLTTSNGGDDGGGAGGDSSSSNGGGEELINFQSSPFVIGETHTSALSIKPPKNTSSNFGVMHLYESNGVLDTELESLIKDANGKRIDKFYAGVDVIYKPTGRKVASCVPLLCPARVFYAVADEKDLHCDVIVGILLDSHGSPYPIIAVYDAYHQFKNLTKGRNVIHSYFGRFQPTSIVHDFTAEQFKALSQELYSYLNIKSALQEMEGIYTVDDDSD